MEKPVRFYGCSPGGTAGIKVGGGHVIPGYEHGVLRVIDPRFVTQMEFARKRFPDDDLLRLADMVLEVVPAVLKEQGTAKNPAPNVDALSGT